MANIYEMIDAYYVLHPVVEPIAPQETVERYFRRRAWKGDDFDDMMVDWELIVLSIETVLEFDLFSLDTLQSADIQDIVGRYLDMHETAHPTEHDVQRVLGILKRFLLFLFPKQAASLEETFAEALRGYYPDSPDGAFRMPERNRKVSIPCSMMKMRSCRTKHSIISTSTSMRF